MSRKLFLSIVKNRATVDARGCVIILHSAWYFGRNTSGGLDCIYRRGLLRCRPTIDGQCEKPRPEGSCIYDLSGRRTRFDTLDKGIYIVVLGDGRSLKIAIR